MWRKAASAILLFLSPLYGQDLPKIVVEGPAAVDFGEYPAIEKKMATFTVRNDGKGTLRIVDVRKTCGCAAVIAGRTNLEAGATAQISISILPNSIFGLYSKNNYVESDDPANRFLCLTVSGNAVPLVRIVPSDFVYAGRLRLKTPWVQAFTLAPTRAGVAFGKPKTESTHPMNVTLAAPEGNNTTLSVQLLPTDKSGDIKCTVAIPIVNPTNYPPLKVTVTGKIGAELAILPGIVYLPVSDEPVTRSFQVKLLGQRTRVLEPQEILAPERMDMTCRTGGKDAQRGVNLTVVFSPEFTRQLMADEVISLDFGAPEASSATLVCKSKKDKPQPAKENAR